MKKIMFNDKFGLTSAVLNGTKTMTRRILPDGTPLGNWAETVRKSRYQVGDVVAVAQCYEDAILDVGEEKWNRIHPWYCVANLCARAGLHNKMFVRADLMPHRIRITSIKAERLQEISNQDCIMEGIRRSVVEYGEKKIVQWTYFTTKRAIWFNSPRDAFASLIDKISGQGTWKANPWVWVYIFELTD